MQKPNTATIPKRTVEAPKVAKPAKKAAVKTVRATYTMTETQEKKVNQLSLKMAQKRGKSVSASEALRVIIDAYES